MLHLILQSGKRLNDCLALFLSFIVFRFRDRTMDIINSLRLWFDE